MPNNAFDQWAFLPLRVKDVERLVPAGVLIRNDHFLDEALITREYS
jgi:hypothetical protein